MGRQKRSMRGAFTPNYSSCSSEDLQMFIKARTGEKPAPHERRRRYIEILEALDDNPTFRFLDLAPELRNRVYEELLTRDTANGRRAYPQLLRTCRQVHHEASGILGAESFANVSAIVDYTQVLYSGDMRGTMNNGWSGSMLHLEQQFGRLKSRNIRVTINKRGGLISQPADEQQQVMGFLDAMVRTCMRLRTCEIKVKEPMSIVHGQSGILRMLSPLMSLSSETTLKLNGLDEATEKDFWRQVSQMGAGA